MGVHVFKLYAPVNNSHIIHEQVIHKHIVSVVIMGQSLVQSSSEILQRTLCYCRNNIVMRTALGALSTIVTDLTSYNVWKSISDLYRRVDDSATSRVGYWDWFGERRLVRVASQTTYG